MVAIVATLLGIAYANALDGAFVFDDEVSIVENSSIRRLLPLGDVLFTKAEGGRTHDSRPLLNLSLAVNYAAHGLWRPGFRVVNLAIHLGNTLLVFDVARRLLRLNGWRGTDARLLAGITAVLWAVHPLHTAVNTYVIQRAESLAAFFILAACDAAIVALSRGSLVAAAVAGVLANVGGGAFRDGHPLTPRTTVQAMVAFLELGPHEAVERADADRAADARRRGRPPLRRPRARRASRARSCRRRCACARAG